MGRERWGFGDYEHNPCGGVQEIVGRRGEVVCRVECDEGDKRAARLVAAAPELVSRGRDLLDWIAMPEGVAKESVADNVVQAFADAVAKAAPAPHDDDGDLDDPEMPEGE